MSQPQGHTETKDMSNVYEKSAPWIAHSIVTVVILVIAIGVVSALLGSKPKANRWGDRPAPSVAVEISPLKAQSYDVWVDSYGTAESLTRTNLVSDVNGRVVSVSPNIRPGKTFQKGDVLARLDDRDFKVEVDIAASAAADAEVVYLQEVAQAEFAAQEWNEPPDTEAARKLALREPQVAAAEASLRAAKARLAKAKLDLERTMIVAPFDGKVLQQMVDVGQVVSPSQTIAEIYSTDVVEVRLPVKMADLQHLQLPESSDEQQNLPRVMLESDLGSRTYQWQGEIVRTEGAFDPATRMLYVVAKVSNPFESNAQRPAMRIGQFVRAKLQGNTYDNVYVIPRRAISQDLQVAIASDGVLQKRQVTPLWTDANSVVIAASTGNYGNDFNDDIVKTASSPLIDSDLLILTPTANLPNGTRVKAIGDNPSGPGRIPDSSLMSNHREAPERAGSEAENKNQAPKDSSKTASNRPASTANAGEL